MSEDIPPTPKSRFSKYIGLYGFVIAILVDTITLFSIFFASSSGPVPIALNPFWWLAFCVVMFFSYLAVLEWVVKSKHPELSYKSFINGLLFKFEYPTYFVPIVIIIILFISSLVYCSMYSQEFLNIIINVGGAFAALGVIFMVSKVSINHVNHSKDIINKNWGEIDKYLTNKIKNKYFLRSSDINDLISYFDLYSSDADRILVQYSMRHSAKYKYGNVMKKMILNSENNIINNCLINMNHFPNEVYRII